MREMTPKQLAFVENYLAGDSKIESYKKAYVVANMQNSTIRRRAYEVSATPVVAAEIAARRSELARRNGVDADQIISRLKAFADSNIMDFLDVYPNGKFEVNLADIPRELGVLIESVETSEQFDRKGELVKRSAKIKLVNKSAAIKLLAKTAGLLSERHLKQADQIVYNISGMPVPEEPRKAIRDLESDGDGWQNRSLVFESQCQGGAAVQNRTRQSRNAQCEVQRSDEN